MVDQGLLSTPSDIYALQATTLEDLERMGEKSAANLLAAIDHSRHTSLTRLLYGLGIAGVGESTARSLADHFGSLGALQVASEEQVLEVPDVGPVIAASVRTFFTDLRHARELKRLRELGVQWPEAAPAKPAQSASLPLAGLSIVLTGRLERITREEASERLAGLGARVSSSVSKKTSYVIAGAEAGSKLTRAHELGVPVLDEAGLSALLGRR
jgi:DNA ligase (NAD+)